MQKLKSQRKKSMKCTAYSTDFHLISGFPQHVSAIRFLMNMKEIHNLNRIKENYPQTVRKIVQECAVEGASIVDSGSRPGFYILQTDSMEEMEKLLHPGPEVNPIQIFETPVQKLGSYDKENHYD